LYESADLPYFGQWHIGARNVAVEDRLVQRIAAFHGNVVDLPRQPRITNELENEIVEILPETR
jgi:hypothetical protein